MNRPHYHAWMLAPTGRIYYFVKRGFHTRQAARQWAQRRKPKDEFMVRQCECEKCRPPL